MTEKSGPIRNLVIFIAAMLVLLPPPRADAHFQTYWYTTKNCPPGMSRRVDPINVVFYGWADGNTLRNIRHHAGWRNTVGRKQYFSSHGACGPMGGQQASACRVCTRYHVRARKTYHLDRALHETTRGDAHHEDWVQRCHYGLGGHAVDKNGPGGSGFDQGRWELQDAFAGKRNHKMRPSYQGNTQNFKQCDGEYAGSSGLVLYVHIHRNVHREHTR